MIELLLLGQTTIQDVAPQELPPVAGVSWDCSVLLDEQPFNLSGRAPDFAARRVDGRSIRTEVRSTGPDWAQGQFDISAVSSGEDFRRYILTWQTSEGADYLFDMVLLRDQLGIATLTEVSRPEGAARRQNRHVAKGYCKSDFSPTQEGVPSK
jgi:hypothetical protein